jgi:uncharacterized protein
MPNIKATPCSDCPGACCHNLAITVSIVDVARIVRALHLPVHDLLARYVDEDPKEEPYVFRIRRQPISLALMPNGSRVCGCPFLVFVGDHARCGIYESRPGTCRVYPFSDEGGKVFHKPDTLCPDQFSPGGKERKRLQKAIDVYQKEWGIHGQFCAEWNANPPRNASFEKLLDFVDDIIQEGRV